jgi:GT2 family glycosyltransferase
MSVVATELDCIVVNYRTPEDLEEFGESYLVQEYASRLVVVNVDPTKADRLVARALVKRAKGALSAEFSENCGYATAVNRGANMTSSPVLAAFNADIVLSYDSLRLCTEHLLKHPKWGVLGPLQLNRAGKITHGGIYGTHDAPSFGGLWLGEPSLGVRVLRDDCVSVSGSAYFVRRSVWNELQFCPIFKEQFPEAEGAFLPLQFYYEETGLSYHAAAHGYRIVFDGTVEIVHKWHEAVKQNNMETQAAQWMRESQAEFRLFCDNHGIPHD